MLVKNSTQQPVSFRASSRFDGAQAVSNFIDSQNLPPAQKDEFINAVKTAFTTTQAEVADSDIFPAGDEVRFEVTNFDANPGNNYVKVTYIDNTSAEKPIVTTSDQHFPQKALLTYLAPFSPKPGIFAGLLVSVAETLKDAITESLPGSKADTSFDPVVDKIFRELNPSAERLFYDETGA